MKEEESKQNLMGRRIELRGSLGTVRYQGPLMHKQDKSGEQWLGVEWDELNKGKHNGTIEDCVYFLPQNFYGLGVEPQGCASLIKESKVGFGISLHQAIIQKYKEHEYMSEEQREQEQKQLTHELYIATNSHRTKNIEFVGMGQSLQTYASVENHAEIALQEYRISNLGPPGSVGKEIPRVQYLYLDKNMLYCWEQYFQLVMELPFLSTLTLTSNQFRRVNGGDLEKWIERVGKGKIETLINRSLQVLVLIKMNLDWEQVMLLSPVFKYLQELHLVRNHCHAMDSLTKQYPLTPQTFPYLKFINLQENGILSWSEITPFSLLPELRKLTISTNPIPDITYRGPELDGFHKLTSLAMDRTNLKDWRSIVKLNSLPKLKNLRILSTPLHSSLTMTESRTNCIARIGNLESINGSQLKGTERKDAEIVYVRQAYEQFLEDTKEDPRTMTIDSPVLIEYMNHTNPRWFVLAEQHGSPIEMIREMKDIANTAISQQSAQIQIYQEGTDVRFKKKVLVVMTVKALKTMCMKLFKAPNINSFLLMYETPKMGYHLDQDMRQLSFYGIEDGGEVRIVML